MFRHSPIEPAQVGQPPIIFCFVGNKLIVETTGDAASLPDLSIDTISSGGYAELPGIGRTEVLRDLFLGTLDGRPCRTVELRLPSDQGATAAGRRPELDSSGSLTPMGLRSLIGKLDEELMRVAGVASQVLDWDRNHQYCGRCGTQTVASTTERSRTCPKCSLTVYPRISPAIIVAVTRGERILLGHNRRHRGGHVFSVLAGFVEPGESLEDCVLREVMEEVGIEVEEIRYFSSQPWPFPDSLMLAFTARYRSGEISVDGTEIVEAGWFDKDHLPQIPPHGTVARRLIEWFVAKEGGTTATP